MAPTASERISILRNVPSTQTTHYVPNDPFPAASHENALDKLTMIVQQLSEVLDRALTLSAGSINVSTALPTPSASQLIGWSSDGTALVNASPTAVGAGSIGTSSLADTAVTGAKLNDSVVNDLTTVTAASGDYVAIADVSDSNKKKKALISDITAMVANTKLTGDAVQEVHSQTGAVATGTTVIPFDDTIPQNTEGDQYLSLAITPTNASNKLLIEVVIEAANSALGNMIAALFQDSTANALAATYASIVSANYGVNLKLTHEMTAGTTSATTFKVRLGNSNAGTTTVNGNSGTRAFGGVSAASIRITEYKV